VGLNVPTAVKRGIYTIHPSLIVKLIGQLSTQACPECSLKGCSKFGKITSFTSRDELLPMNAQVTTSRFQTVIETVETLPPDDQLLLIEIIRQRLIQYRRAEW
jgi:hypothetical protein